MTQTFAGGRLAGLAIAISGVLLMTGLPAHADQAAPTNTKSRSMERAPQPTPHVVNVRTGQHALFDRVVIDFKGGAPGYDVGYVKEVRADGSGKVVDTRGRANLLVRLTPTNAHHENGSPTYTGPSRFTVDYPSLREVAFAGDFEATVSIAEASDTRAGSA